MIKRLFAAIAFALPVGAAASPVSPVSYTYIVGPTSTSNYLDDTYNGTLGQLTDGFSALDTWQDTDGFGNPGPNVGWQDVNPIIQFSFDQTYDFLNLLMNFQDGQGAAGVGIPRSITVNGITSPMLTGGTSLGPLNTIMNLTPLAPTDTLLVTVTRGFQWTFLSEFTFEADPIPAAIPVPAGLPLLIAGLGALGFLRRCA